MACNGKGHLKDCDCNFRGGHPNSRPPNGLPWSKATFKKYVRESARYCPECSAVIYYVRFSNGGGGFFNNLGKPWIRHACLDKSKEYDPFNLRRVPKMKGGPTQYEKDGWWPLFDVKVETTLLGMQFQGFSVEKSAHLILLSDFTEMPDLKVPIYYRHKEAGWVELDYLSAVTQNGVTGSASILSR